MKFFRNRVIWRITLLYTVFGLLWVLLTDRLLLIWLSEYPQYAQFQTYKGAIFVLISAVLLSLLLAKSRSLREYAEQRLDESEERYRQLFENSMDAILLTAPDGSIFAANRAASEIFGWTEEEICRRGRNGLIDSRDPRLQAALEERARTGRFRGELTFLRKDGSRFPGEVSTNLFRNNAGEQRTTMIIRDVSARHEMEAALRDSEQRYRKLFENNPHPMWIFDLDTFRFLAVNDAAVEHYGYSTEEFLSMTIEDIRPGEDLAAVREVVNNLKGPLGKTGVWRHYKKNGQPIDVEMTTHDLEFDGHRARLVLANDVTERIRTMAALSESEARLRAIFEGAAIGITQVDLQGCILHANPAISAMLGYSIEEMIGQHFSIFSTGEEAAQDLALFAELVDGKRENYQIEKKYLRKDGSTVWSNLIVSLVRNEYNKPQFAIRMLEDITERKQAAQRIQNQLQQISALHTIDLAITASLDLKIVLNVVLEQTIAQLGMDAASVLLYDAHTRTLRFAAGRGFQGREIEKTHIRLGQGHTGRAVLERRTLSLHHFPKLADGFERQELLAGEGFTCYHAAPLIAKGEIKGVLEVFSRTHRQQEEEWQAFFVSFASQAAIAVDNAQLFDNLQRANDKLALAYDATIEGWPRALDLRDKETEGHTLRVTGLTEQMACSAGICDEELVHIRRGSLLHDIGKMGIPDTILLKPGSLTAEEWVIMRQHPVFAYQLLMPIEYLRPALDIPYCHHEKWDGSGYPRGLKGEQIPLAARIFAVVDVWDALRSDRPYRPAWAVEKTLEYIRSQSGSHFEPRMVEIFLEAIQGYLPAR